MRVVARKLGADPSSPDTEHQIIAGGDFTDFEQLRGSDPELLECLPGSRVVRAEVVKAVRDEMAITLADVVLRRTDLGTGARPGHMALRACADLVAGELGWSDAETARQIESISGLFPNFNATVQLPESAVG
jgi:glycerol-3-phosphate dehydrogenase